MVIIAMMTSLFGTFLGALIAMAFRKPAKDFIALMMGFSAGVLIGVVFLDLVPEVLRNEGVVFLSFYFIIGVAIFIVIRLLMMKSSIKIGRITLMTAISIMLHNFPEGLIMGVGFSSQSLIGLKMAIIIILHDIPEGIALISSMMIDSQIKDRLNTLFYVLLTVFPTTIGLIIGMIIGRFSETFVNVNFALAAGIMGYVCFVEMIPEAYLKNKNFLDVTLSVVAGLFVSIVIILIVY